MIERVYIHCSDSDFGSENLINHWHKLRRFGTMVDGYHISTGYHLVILNGRPNSDKKFYGFLDGSIETARKFGKHAAAVRGDNKHTLHYCLIGKDGVFSNKQIMSLFEALRWNVGRGLAVKNILGHYEFWTRKGKKAQKTCPGIKMNDLRENFKEYLSGNGCSLWIEPNNKKIIKSKLHKLLYQLDKILKGWN